VPAAGSTLPTSRGSETKERLRSVLRPGGIDRACSCSLRTCSASRWYRSRPLPASAPRYTGRPSCGDARLRSYLPGLRTINIPKPPRAWLPLSRAAFPLRSPCDLVIFTSSPPRSGHHHHTAGSGHPHIRRTTATVSAVLHLDPRVFLEDHDPPASRRPIFSPASHRHRPVLARHRCCRDSDRGGPGARLLLWDAWFLQTSANQSCAVLYVGIIASCWIA